MTQKNQCGEWRCIQDSLDANQICIFIFDSDITNIVDLIYIFVCSNGKKSKGWKGEWGEVISGLVASVVTVVWDLVQGVHI